MWGLGSTQRAPKGDGEVRGVFLGTFVVLLHIGLVSLATLFIMVLGSLFEYRLFLFLGTVGLVGCAGYAFYRRFDSHAKQVLAVWRDPAIRGRSLEVSLLGGAASLRIGRAEDDRAALPAAPVGGQLLAPEGDSGRVRDLVRLADLYECGHISEEEFARLKRGLLPATTPGPALLPARPAAPSGSGSTPRPAAPTARPAVRPAAPLAPAAPERRTAARVAGWVWR